MWLVDYDLFSSVEINTKAAQVPQEIAVGEDEPHLSDTEIDKYFFNEEEQSKR